MIYRRTIMLGLLTLGLTACDSSQDLSAIPGKGKTETISAHYLCDNNQTIAVRYLNNETNAIAVVDLPETKDLMMVNVVAASGDKYVGTIYEWWVKGDTAMLTNVIQNKTQQCSAKK